MNKENFSLTPVSTESIKIFKAESEKIIKECLDSAIATAKRPETEYKLDIDMLKAGYDMMYKMLLPILEYGDFELLQDQIDWSSNRLPAYGIDKNTFEYNMKFFREAVKKNLPKPNADEIISYLEYIKLD